MLFFRYPRFYFDYLQTDERTYNYIADQISGIYLGWAKLKVHGFSKVVIGTGWNFSQQTVERVMVGSFSSYLWLFSSGRPQLPKCSPIVLSFFSGTRSVNIGDPVIFTNILCIARFLHFSFLYVYLICYFPFADSRVS